MDLPRQGQPIRADEVLQTPFGKMARFGRFIHLQNTLTPESHAELRDALIDSATQLRDQQGKLRKRLVEIFELVDPIDLLGRASLSYLTVDPDTYKEWASDRSPAHVEYLALQTLTPSAKDRSPIGAIEATQLTFEALELSRKLFDISGHLLVREAMKSHRDQPDDPNIEYTLQTRIESLAIRGASYDEHLIRVLHGCLDPFSVECRELLGFTVADAIKLGEAIPKLVLKRLRPRQLEAAEFQRETLRALKRDRRRGRSDHLPAWLIRLPPTEAKLQVDFMTTAYLYENSRALTEIAVEELAVETEMEPTTVEAFLRAFTCEVNEFNLGHHAYPCGAHPLTVHPILKGADGYILPVPSSFRSAIRPAMEDLLRRHAGVWNRYAEARGQFVEREAIGLIAGILPGSESWTGIKWKSTTCESDLDGLVGTDDVTLRLQCKAGRLSAPARRGAPKRMRKDIGDLIEQAAGQHATLNTALMAEGAQAVGFTHEQAEILNSLYQFEVIVCLDDVTVWATEAHRLKSLGILPKTASVPWVLSLTDLMVIADLLDGAQLVHYLMRRQRLERDGRIKAHDELDWVGNYLLEGLYFDQFFEEADSPDIFRLMSYTEKIDSWYLARSGARRVETAKPEQAVPKRLGKLLLRLAKERPEHWISASVALLDSDYDARDEWESAIEHIGEHVARTGWSNASMLFGEDLGVTIYVDLRRDFETLKSAMKTYCRDKAESFQTSNWVAIGEASTEGLFVTLFERNPRKPLADVFQQPPTSNAGNGSIVSNDETNGT